MVTRHGLPASIVAPDTHDERAIRQRLAHARSGRGPGISRARCPQRVSHPVYGAANGVTRLYGPRFSALGGAYVDVGNAYLQPPHQDIEPVPGQLLLFPSWLAHQAMPYDGDIVWSEPKGLV